MTFPPKYYHPPSHFEDPFDDIELDIPENVTVAIALSVICTSTTVAPTLYPHTRHISELFFINSADHNYMYFATTTNSSEDCRKHVDYKIS